MGFSPVVFQFVFFLVFVFLFYVNVNYVRILRFKALKCLGMAFGPVLPVL